MWRWIFRSMCPIAWSRFIDDWDRSETHEGLIDVKQMIQNCVWQQEFERPTCLRYRLREGLPSHVERKIVVCFDRRGAKKKRSGQCVFSQDPRVNFNVQEPYRGPNNPVSGYKVSFGHLRWTLNPFRLFWKVLHEHPYFCSTCLLTRLKVAPRLASLLESMHLDRNHYWSVMQSWRAKRWWMECTLTSDFPFKTLESTRKSLYSEIKSQNKASMTGNGKAVHA